ncbi:MAG: hypothetical protein HUJ73_03410 [Eubacterium sp.]|nr:hypothetical protein [Eubacterium sp.]
MKNPLTRDEIKTIISRVVHYFVRKRELKVRAGRVLFLVPEYPMGLKQTIMSYDLYGELDGIDFVLAKPDPDVAGICRGKIYLKDDPEDMRCVFTLLPEYEEINIYTPSLDFLRALREGREEDLMVRAALFFLMNGKVVIVRLPYRAGSLKDGRFAKQLRDLMDDLWEMGVSFSEMDPHFGDGTPEKVVLAAGLVTEDLVEEYYRRGFSKIRVDDHTIVTPLAADRAREHGIQISR